MFNVKTNRELRELKQVNEIFFYPACDGSGTPIGAALFIYFHLCKINGKKVIHCPLEDLYLGREFNNQNILKIIRNSISKVNYVFIDNIEETVVEKLVEGKIIARFNERGEFGSHTLGNRSIVAKVDDLSVIRKTNFAIKKRDFWMSFAPSIIETDMKKYLVNPKPARYMIEAFSTKPATEEIIAALHPFDNTVRPQTVNEWNESWLKLLRIFKEISGYSVLLNTSFNLHGFPIVGTPEVAIDTLINSGLGYVAIGNFLVHKK